MPTILEVPFKYPATVIPKRARKERDVFLAAAFPVQIPELDPADAPVVMEADLEYDFVVRTGDGPYDSAWTHKLVSVQFRRHDNKLLRPFDAVYQCGFQVPETFSVTREHAPELFSKILRTMDGCYDFEILSVVEPMRRDTFQESEFVGKILSEHREERTHLLSKWIDSYGLVFIDDLLWRETELPVWSVGYRGAKRYLRPVPYENCQHPEDAFWNTELSRSTFQEDMAEKLEYSRATRTALEIAPDRGQITILSELPFGRNEVIQKLFECVTDTIIYSRSREVPDDLLFALTALMNEYDAARRDEGVDPSPFLGKLIEFNEAYSKLPKNKHFNPLSYQIERIERLLPSLSSRTKKAAKPLKPFSHRARRANGYDTVPAQALLPIETEESIILIDREDARRAAAAFSTETSEGHEVKTYQEVFQVDGLSAFRPSGASTLTAFPKLVGGVHQLSEVLANKQLDILAKCDWETWRRGAGIALRPDGIDGIVARIWFRKNYASSLYIFFDNRYTYEAIEFCEKVGDAKQLCEAALEAYGYGIDYFDKHFGDIFRLKRDRLHEAKSQVPEDTGIDFDFDDAAFED